MAKSSEKAQNTAEAKSFIEKSLKLFELAHKNLSGDIIVKENFQLDYAASSYVAGQILLKSDKKPLKNIFLKPKKWGQEKLSGRISAEEKGE